MAVGAEALRGTATATSTLAIGFRVLFMNTTGSVSITGIGAAALRKQHDRFGQYRHWFQRA